MFTHTPIDLLPDVNTIQKHGMRFYKVGDNLYPSITTILSDGDKPWLTDWRNSIGNKVADKITKHATDRGTAVHLMIEKLLNNDPNPMDKQTIEHKNEFLSLRLYLKKINNIIAQETALWSDQLQIAGRVDCIGYYKDKLCIIDFKTSTNNKTEQQISDYKLQVAAYSLMFEEMYGIQIDNYSIIMSCEKSAVPLIFTGEIEPHLKPLLKKIKTFHEKHRSKK